MHLKNVIFHFAFRRLAKYMPPEILAPESGWEKYPWIEFAQIGKPIAAVWLYLPGGMLCSLAGLRSLLNKTRHFAQFKKDTSCTPLPVWVDQGGNGSKDPTILLLPSGPPQYHGCVLSMHLTRYVENWCAIFLHPGWVVDLIPTQNWKILICIN